MTQTNNLMRRVSSRGRKRNSAQSGVFLLEALIALLIFSLGLLGLVAMGAAAIAAQSDAQYRAEAAKFTGEILGEIWLNVNRTDATTVATSLAAFQHQTSGANCSFSGTPASSPMVATWSNRILAAGSGLPGATAAGQQIVIDTNPATGFNKVTVSVCWQAPQDKAPRRHLAVGFVN
jgi:type IV pilus assembly protein PilV